MPYLPVAISRLTSVKVLRKGKKAKANVSTRVTQNVDGHIHTQSTDITEMAEITEITEM